ncbi:nitrate- and nitrite sensing domain-containing protein [Erwinia sp. P6884]|uniref:nitrate- and nitrite sensing domain-containing protein n=1 Tax=Erwinia sp. P6884 TaxID=3141450 RepID=UPI003192204B
MPTPVPSARAYLMASRQSEIASLQTLLQTGQLTGEISQLVHELQRERGVSNIWLCSQGTMFGDELPVRERQVATTLASMLSSLPPLNGELTAPPGHVRVYSRIAAALHALGGLASLRQNVRHFRLSHDEAMRQFSHIIRQLLNLAFEMIDTASDPQVSRALIAMFSFMQGKELAGQERATGSAGYAAGSFSAGQRERMLGLIEAQERCFTHFCHFADAKSLQRWRGLAEGESDIERLRRIACTRSAPEGDGAEMALRWYQRMTRRIDGLKQVEDELAQHLMQCCRESIRQAQHQQEAQEGDIDALVAQIDTGPAFSVYVAGQDWLKQEGQSLDTGGLTPGLGRSVLGLVEAQSRQLEALDDELTAMRATLSDRKQIDRAKALLIRHHHYGEEQAWQALRKMAMDQNRRIVDIAEALLAVADVFPATPK